MSPSETFLRLRALAPRDGSATRDEAADEPPPAPRSSARSAFASGATRSIPPRATTTRRARPRWTPAGACRARAPGARDGNRTSTARSGPRGPPTRSTRCWSESTSERSPRTSGAEPASSSPREPRRSSCSRSAPATDDSRGTSHEPSATWTPRTPPSSRRPSCSSPSTTTPPHAADATSATTRAFRASGDPSLPNPRRGCFEWTRWSPSRTRGPQPSRRFQSLMSFCVAGNRWAWTGPPRCARGRACASTCWWARRTTGYAASRGPRGDRARVRTRAANSRTNSRTRTRTRMTRPPTQVGKPGSNPRGRRTRWTGSSASSSRR